MVAESNGVLNKNPMALKRQAGDGTLADVHLVYEALCNVGLIEFFSNIRTTENRTFIDEYIYLSDYLVYQKFWTKAQLPSPPWVKYKPLTKVNGEIDTSRGRYFDIRQECNLLSVNTYKDETFDNNPQTEVKGKEVKGKEVKESANASKEDKKIIDIDKSKTPYERMATALKEVLDDRYKIRPSLAGNKLDIQKQQILSCLKGNTINLGIGDIIDKFDIEPDGNDWKPYQKPKTTSVKQTKY